MILSHDSLIAVKISELLASARITPFVGTLTLILIVKDLFFE